MRSGKIYFFLFILFISASGFGQQGHNIILTLKPFKNSLVYLAYYYGKVKGLADSTILDENSRGLFAGKEKLPGGIYLIVSPKKEILFEVVIDSQQNFSISADTVDLVQSLTFTGSPENK